MAASDSGIDSQSSPELTDDPPMSRTHQYRHMIKPLLERKRRARINKCLDELKDLMVSALQKDGESITKLEKADVLELTVRHLRKLKAHGVLNISPGPQNRYLTGYSLCAGEISKYVASGASGLEPGVSARLLHHLSAIIRGLESSSQPPLMPPHCHLPSPFLLAHKPFKPPPTPNLAEYFSQSKLEALRFSLGQSSSPSPSFVNVRTPSPVSPPQHSHHVVKAEVALVPTADKEDDKAWRPWSAI